MKQNTIKIKRSEAAKLINDIREVLIWEKDCNDVKKIIDKLNYIMEQKGIKKYIQCDGQAHTNPYIDNCFVCMPNWGYLGDKVTVK